MSPFGWSSFLERELYENAKINLSCAGGFGICTRIRAGVADGWGWTVSGYPSADGVVADEERDLENVHAFVVEFVSRFAR